ncbi:TonB-dependent siderophore receptor, partial [Burkholderia pseudomallei]
MEWATSKRVRAIAAGVGFYAAAAGHAKARAAQQGADARQPGGEAKADTEAGGTLPAISVSGAAERDASDCLVARRSM